MRRPLKIFLTFVLAAGFATGCGSDDDSSGGGGGSGGSDKPKASAKADDAKPKKQSARAEMVKCMEEEGFEVSHEGDDDEKATNYTIEAGGKKKAEVIIHSTKNGAASAARKVGEEKGTNSIPFGRVEFRNNDSATDTEAGVLANCVAEAYVH
jgi:hypothetical protein